MPSPQPAILIVTTQTWLQLTRMALRLARYGCQVSALCPAQSELRFLKRLHTFHTFKGGDPFACLAGAIESSGAAYLVPGDDHAVWLLHELCIRLPQYRSLVERSIGPERSFRTMRSRARLIELASKLSIDAPETATLPTLEAARLWARDRKAPFVLKRDGTFGGGGVEVVQNPDDLDASYARLHASPAAGRGLKQRLLPAAGSHFKKVSSLDFGGNCPWIAKAEVSAQTYIEGVAANAMFACDKGRILGSVQARVVAAKGKTGPALMIDLLRDRRMERAGVLLAAALELSGFFGLDFILEQRTGTPYLIEMNPRCTQLGHVALAGQRDLSGLLWARWSGGAPPAVGSRELAASICFYPQGMASAAGSRFSERARLDVCAEDREIVDRLALGGPTLLARSYRAARTRLTSLKHRLAPPVPGPIHYFQPLTPGDAAAQDRSDFPALGLVRASAG